MTLVSQSFTSKVVQWDGIMYEPDSATELRASGWLDDLDMGLGRKNEGPLLRGWVKTHNSAHIVFPGDFILRRVNEKGDVERIVVDPHYLVANYDGGEHVQATNEPVDPAGTPDSLDPSFDTPPSTAPHQPVADDPSGADVQNIQQDDWTTKATGEVAPVERPVDVEGPPVADTPVEPVPAEPPADDSPPADVPADVPVDSVPSPAVPTDQPVDNPPTS